MNEQYITLIGKVCSPRYEEVYTPEVKSKLPIEASSEGRKLKDYTIYGNNNPNHIDESQSTLPVSIDTYGGNAVDWEIYGNNNPVVENKTGALPLTFTAKGGTAVDWEIRGNDLPGTENLFDKNSYSATGKNLVYTGEENAANAWSISEYIEVTSNTTFTLANVVGGSPSLCWYNNNKEYLSGEKYNNRTTITVTSPMNAAYIRISVVTDTENPYHNENTIMLVRGSTAPDHYIPYQKGVGENTEITRELPIDFRSNGDDLLGYKIYGTADEAGVQTENYGYKIPLKVTRGTESKTVDIYIGDSKLGEEEYVDYGEQKIYKRILFMTYDDKHFITKDNKDFCLRRTGYSG